MSMIATFITMYLDYIILFGVPGYFIVKQLYKKIKIDGWQSNDVSEAVAEGMADYRAALAKMEEVIDDVTIDPEATCAMVKNIITMYKTFK